MKYDVILFGFDDAILENRFFYKILCYKNLLSRLIGDGKLVRNHGIADFMDLSLLLFRVAEISRVEFITRRSHYDIQPFNKSQIKKL